VSSLHEVPDAQKRQQANALGVEGSACAYPAVMSECLYVSQLRVNWVAPETLILFRRKHWLRRGSAAKRNRWYETQSDPERS
jgi:hypothetical protein